MPRPPASPLHTDSAAEDGHALSLLIRHKVHDGRLPHNRIAKISSGLGAGETCDACETAITKEQSDGGWPLRRVLHHLARSERLYAASIDEALPGDDPTDRYEEACRRLDETLRTAEAGGEDASIVYAGLYGVLQSREEVVDWVLAIESELLGPGTQ